ncbi:hypothetical protein [Acetivibrio ethanolgignens]|uniref:Uncharacterized protein n=1 Tax=Acetivibrio ethanolgignens TaxID=290052 RepID=A0A0V8QIF3_9FIRM|nr:hypothetical protein [Acetivibrio ethanolgignens]KSV60284.1 hypothetical protein ASU35_05890 [Acetivibrio ethanolgignens]
MTKNEFDSRFDAAYRNNLLSLSDKEALKKRLSKYADENGKISNESFLLISLEMNKDLFKAILSELLVNE